MKKNRNGEIPSYTVCRCACAFRWKARLVLSVLVGHSREPPFRRCRPPRAQWAGVWAPRRLEQHCRRWTLSSSSLSSPPSSSSSSSSSFPSVWIWRRWFHVSLDIHVHVLVVVVVVIVMVLFDRAPSVFVILVAACDHRHRRHCHCHHLIAPMIHHGGADVWLWGTRLSLLSDFVRESQSAR